jgi:hypothetical protein
MTVIDEEGLDLPGIDAARERGIANAREMACAEVLDGHLDLRHRIDVSDEDGKVVFTLTFRDTIDVLA